MVRSYFLIGAAALLSASMLFSQTSFGVSPAVIQSTPIANSVSFKTFQMKPKLVVVIVIDQCRSDFLTRFAKRMESNKAGGLSYLMKNGAYFPFAKYDILQSMTCAGHATVLTGAYPYQMGIPLNDWYDSSAKKDVYCADDADAKIVGREMKPDELGLSPRMLIGSTVGDELKIAGYKSQVVAIALKDRSAIMMGGHRADVAVWMEEGKWVSSRYYLPEGNLPKWVTELNAGLEKEKGKTFKWKTAGQPSGLTSFSPDKPFSEVVMGTEDSFATQYGVKVTTDAAIRALRELKLGQGGTPDILAVSYSSHDMLGHDRGLQAPEMENITMYEDESIGELLQAIDKSVGLRNVVFAFTADHGVAPATDVLKQSGFPSGRIDRDELKAVNDALEKKWGKSSKGPWIAKIRSLNFYLDPAVIADKKKSREEVELEVKNLILQSKPNGEVGRAGIAAVFTRTEVEKRQLPQGRYERQILNTFITGRSGDVIAIPKPFWYEKSRVFTTHLTGYEYDRSVPLILAGDRFKAGVYSSTAEVVDIAPTLSFILGLVPPSGSDGRVLGEALK